MTGLKANQIHRLQHIYRRKVPAQQIVTQELARYLCELSLEINRQIGVLIDRKGIIEYVVVGDHKSFSPILGARAWQQIVCAVCATCTRTCAVSPSLRTTWLTWPICGSMSW